jgi:hypothetical protein
VSADDWQKAFIFALFSPYQITNAIFGLHHLRDISRGIHSKQMPYVEKNLAASLHRTTH